MENKIINLQRRLSPSPIGEGRGGAPVIDARGLTKQFGNFIATNHITFQVHEGEIFGFLGANGA